METIYISQGNCFAIYRGGKRMAVFEMEYQALVFVNAMLDAFGGSVKDYVCIGEYHESLGF